MPNEYIEIQNGVHRIKGTRVALDSIVYKFRQGRSPEAIQDAFPAWKTLFLPSPGKTSWVGLATVATRAHATESRYNIRKQGLSRAEDKPRKTLK